MCVCLTLQVVVVGVLCHPAVEECPGQVIYSVLFVLNRLRHNLSVEVVVHAVVKMGLQDRESMYKINYKSIIFLYTIVSITICKTLIYAMLC